MSDTRISDEDRKEALRRALRHLPSEHHGWPHRDGRQFRYATMVCPGCAHSVLKEMLRELVSS